MKRLAIAVLMLAGIAAATAAQAVELRTQKIPFQQPQYVGRTGRFATSAVLGCDNGNAYSAYYQSTDDRLGNVFNFGSGAVLSTLQFAHFGYGLAGPYSYDIELWDATSCTFISAKNGLSAADAAADLAVETVDLCGDNLFVAGDVAVTIDPNTCLSATDCYPDLLIDDQTGVVCPLVILDASTAPYCYPLQDLGGPFLLRVETDNCPTPAAKRSWGTVKTLYR